VADKSEDGPQRPAALTKKGVDILVRVERLMDDATKALASSDKPVNRADSQGAGKEPAADAFASASAPQGSATRRGN
jgi:hypothetical protein